MPDREEAPMRGTIITIIATCASLAALTAWLFAATAAGSGWILRLAFAGTLGLLTSIQRPGLVSISGLLISAAAGLCWYFHQELPNAKWVLVLSICAGLITFNSLNDLVASETDR